MNYKIAYTIFLLIHIIGVMFDKKYRETNTMIAHLLLIIGVLFYSFVFTLS